MRENMMKHRAEIGCIYRGNKYLFRRYVNTCLPNEIRMRHMHQQIDFPSSVGSGGSRRQRVHRPRYRSPRPNLRRQASKDRRELPRRTSGAVAYPKAAVDTPLHTGIISIDSMIPIGRGQRELIIGDRQTGKTSAALTAILNQKTSGVLCIYCAIGQKASNISNTIKTLREKDAMKYSVVVVATASDSPVMQYLAPYSACSVVYLWYHHTGVRTF